MKQKKWLKILIPVVAVVLVAAIGLSIWHFGSSANREPVGVVSFLDVGMTEYWADSQESYGPVTTDNVQTVYLSDTQIVTEVLVNQGDMVQKGDVLMVFDTTLSDLAIERERLSVEKLKLQLSDAREELSRIKNMKPMVIPEPTEPPDPDQGIMLTEPYKISQQPVFDGSAPEKALICWIRSDTEVTDALLEAVRQAAIDYQTKNAPVEEPTEPSEDPTEATEETTDPTEETSETTEPTEETGEATEPTEETDPSEDPTEPSEDPTEPSEDPTEPSEDPSEPSEDPTEPSENPTDPTEPTPVEVNSFYVIFKVTAGDMSLGSTQVYMGMNVKRNPATGTFTFSLFDASGIPDHTLAVPDVPDIPDIDYGSGYTASQIAEMRSQQEKTIQDLVFQVKMAEAQYKIKQTEIADGKVVAQFDGEVVSVLSEEEARTTNQPMLKVSGGGGYYIEGSVHELERDNISIGQEVTINDWNTGMTYTGTIQSIGDTPSNNDMFDGSRNPNASFYPFTVFVDESANLQESYYASVTFTADNAQNGIYLNNPFLRTSQGQS